jgi:hypothetical protein
MQETYKGLFASLANNILGSLVHLELTLAAFGITLGCIAFTFLSSFGTLLERST